MGASFYNLADDDVPDVVDPTLAQVINGAGVGYEARSAKSSSEAQAQDIDGLVAAGARVLIVAPGQDGASLPAIQRAVDAGIPVLTIRDPIPVKSLYVGFDPVEEGRQEARALLALKPKGRYVIVTWGAPAAESDPRVVGIREILQPAVDRGDITVLATVHWQWGGDSQELQAVTAVLTQNGGVDAVAAIHDQLASFPVAKVLEDAGLTGKVAVGGMDYYLTGGGLMALARNQQAVEVWGDDRLVARATAEAAIALCRDPDIAHVAGSASVTWPGHDPMQAILLDPITITKDNLGNFLDTDPRWWNLVCTLDPSVAPLDLPATCKRGPLPSASPPQSSPSFYSLGRAWSPLATSVGWDGRGGLS